MQRFAPLLAAFLFAASAAAAPPPVVVDPAAFVPVADSRKSAKTPDAAKKPATAKKPEAKKPVAKTQDAKKPDAKKGTTQAQGQKKPQQSAKKPADKKPTYGGHLADFGKTQPSADVMHVANWVAYTGKNTKYAYVIIDKKNARLYVFDNQSKLRGDAPVLLGKSIGDTAAPGVAKKRLSQLKEHEKTTPAGWFAARPGLNNHGEDVIWIDYDSAVSMHRLRPVDPKERRAHRLATPTSEDNRISNGCVNVPPKFYDQVLRPVVKKYHAYVFVLPETKTPQQLFASYDVQKQKDGKGVQVAQAAREP